MRISDWSSDVCSSDLTRVATLRRAGRWMPGPAGKRGQACDNAAFTPQGRAVGRYRRPPMSDPMRNIRNFSIIAHVDHGKSTLADRIIQLCGGLTAREMESQVLDNNPIERERGITIKAKSVSLPYTARDGQVYHPNFIDTPCPVDFSYEIGRAHV